MPLTNLTLTNSSRYYEAIEQSNETQFRQLRHATIRYPIIRTGSVAETLDYVLNNNGLMVTG